MRGKHKLKSLFAVCLVVAMIFSSMPSQVMAISEGTGISVDADENIACLEYVQGMDEASSYYTIKNGTDMELFRDIVNGTISTDASVKVISEDGTVLEENRDSIDGLAVNAKLMNDITVVGWDKSITNSDGSYGGCFDGNGYQLTLEGCQSLFKKISANGVVKDLTINASVEGSSGEDAIGIVCTWLEGLVYNVRTTGYLTWNSTCVGNLHMGGLVGGCSGGLGKILDCRNEADITLASHTNENGGSGNDPVGGIIGWNCGSEIRGCVNTGDVSILSSSAPTQYIGGIIGSTTGGKVIGCYNEADLDGSSYVGGIVGYNTADIENCGNTGNMTGSGDYIGGIAGTTDHPIRNCFNHGNIEGVRYLGGIVGQSGSDIRGVYNTGDVTATESLGYAQSSAAGIVGAYSPWSGASLEYGFNSGAITAYGGGGGIVGTNWSSVASIKYGYNAGDIYVMPVNGKYESGGIVGALSGKVLDSKCDTSCVFTPELESSNKLFISDSEAYTYSGVIAGSYNSSQDISACTGNEFADFKEQGYTPYLIMSMWQKTTEGSAYESWTKSGTWNSLAGSAEAPVFGVEVEETPKPEVSETPEVEVSEEPKTSETPEVEVSEEPNASETPEVEVSEEPNASETPEIEVSEVPNASETPEVEVSEEPNASETPEVEVSEVPKKSEMPSAIPSEKPSEEPNYQLPVLTQKQNVLTLAYNDVTQFSCLGYAYVGEENPGEVSTWSRFTSLGKVYVDINGTKGYTKVNTQLHDGYSFEMTNGGYYVTYLKYYDKDGKLCEDYAVWDSSAVNSGDGSGIPSVSQHDNTLILNYNGVSQLTCLGYAYVGTGYPGEITTWAQYTTLGKMYKNVNGTKGYTKINTELFDGYSFEMTNGGYYVTYLKYYDKDGKLCEDYAVWECVVEDAGPEFVAVEESDKTTVTLQTNGYEVISMGYSYTGVTAHEFGAWSIYTEYGKQYEENAVDGVNKGYKKAMGATDGDYFELVNPKTNKFENCFYTCYIKYYDNAGEIDYVSYVYQVGTKTPYFSQTNKSGCVMHDNGFKTISTGYVYTENDLSGQDITWQMFVAEGKKYAINSDADYSNKKYSSYSDISLKMNYRKAYMPANGCQLYFDAQSYTKESYSAGYYIAFIKYEAADGTTKMIFNTFDVESLEK